MSRFISILLLGALIAGTPLAHAGSVAGTPEPPAAEIVRLPEPAPADSRDIRAYKEAVAATESDQGAFAPGLHEQLLGLGRALQIQERHTEAIQVFKRGVHLARINDGLYSREQIPLIQGEITSYLATGSLADADERQHYLHRVQQRALVRNEEFTQALMQQADWQYHAFLLGIGEQRFHRLLSMRDLYRLAANDIVDREGKTSISLLPPLHGLLQTQYLIGGYNFEGSSGMTGSDSDFSARQKQNRFYSYKARNLALGRNVIELINEVTEANSQTPHLDNAETLVMLGDWMLYNGEMVSAVNVYKEAHRELAELDDAQMHIDRLFGSPEPLPAMKRIRPLPPIAEPAADNLLLEFGINQRGRVVDLDRLDDNDISQGAVNRFMRQLRNTRFRPKFEAGEPVETEKMVRAYEISN